MKPSVATLVDSKIQWLGKINADFSLSRLGWHLQIVTGKKDVNEGDPAGRYPFFTCSRTPTRSDHYSFDCEALLVAGNGEVGHTQYYVGRFEAYQRTYVLTNFTGLLPSYVRRYLEALLLNALANRRIGSVIDFIKLGDLRPLPIPVPPLPTQKAIADYLDKKTAAIDALIDKKQKLLTLLAEKRAALINQAVTKGLDPSVPMKDSGIPWIGEIPAHWEVLSVRRVVQRIEQGWSPLCYNQLAELGEWAVLKVGSVNGGTFRSSEHKALPAELQPIPSLEVQDGDLLMSRANTSELVGSTAVAIAPRPRLLLCDKLYRIRLSSRCRNQFFALAMASAALRMQFEATSSGASSSMQNIGQERLRDFVMGVPPMKEQSAIEDAVAARTTNALAVEAKLTSQIDRLQEYRQALITAAVTGQLDIEEAA